MTHGQVLVNMCNFNGSFPKAKVTELLDHPLSDQLPFHTLVRQMAQTAPMGMKTREAEAMPQPRPTAHGG